MKILPRSTDKRLLTLNIHYFLYHAAVSCVQQYGTAVGRGNGITETTIAYIFTFIPLATVVLKPVCGFIVDRIRNATAVLILLQITALVSFGVVFSTQYIRTEDTDLTGLLICPEEIAPLLNVSSSCVQQSLKCNFSCWQSRRDSASFKSGDESALGYNNSDVCETLLWNQTNSHGGESSCTFTCTCHERSPRSLVLGLYMVFVVLGFAATGTANVISNAALCELLGSEAQSFGRHRFWGVLGFGLSSPLLGVFIDEANKVTEGRSGYTPALVLFAVFLLTDMLLLLGIPRLTMAKTSSTIFKDARVVFSCPEVMVFALWACFLGALFAITSSYTTWLLEDMEASKLNIGLYTAVSTLVELPLFFLSGQILKRIGYFPACSLAFASYAVSYVGCSFVRKPWNTLLTAIPNGVAYSLAQSTITVFAKDVAPSGTTASVMCIMDVLGFDGVGAALGNLCGGAGFGKYGARATFRYAGIAAFVCMVLCTLSRIVIRRQAGLYPVSS